jgi:hypothetical protein
MNFPIQDQYAAEYLALVAAGATHDEAVKQIAQTNEVPVDAVEKEVA